MTFNPTAFTHPKATVLALGSKESLGPEPEDCSLTHATQITAPHAVTSIVTAKHCRNGTASKLAARWAGGVDSHNLAYGH
jgi:hypothetical protein